MSNSHPTGLYKQVAVGPLKPEQPITCPVKLFRMAFLVKDHLYQFTEYRGYGICSCQVMGRVLFSELTVLGIQMFLQGGISILFWAPLMQGDLFSSNKDVHEIFGVDNLCFLSDMATGCTIEVSVPAQIDMPVFTDLKLRI